MKDKKTVVKDLSSSEVRLLEQLRAHPEMKERLQGILDIACNQEAPLRSADEVEELLIQEMRRFGNTSMHQWAKQTEQRVVDELKAQDPALRSRKKKR